MLGTHEVSRPAQDAFPHVRGEVIDDVLRDRNSGEKSIRPCLAHDEHAQTDYGSRLKDHVGQERSFELPHTLKRVAGHGSVAIFG